LRGFSRSNLSKRFFVVYFFSFFAIKKKRNRRKKRKKRCHKARHKVLCLNKSNGKAIAGLRRRKCVFSFWLIFLFTLRLKRKSDKDKVKKYFKDSIIKFEIIFLGCRVETPFLFAMIKVAC